MGFVTLSFFVSRDYFVELRVTSRNKIELNVYHISIAIAYSSHDWDSTHVQYSKLSGGNVDQWILRQGKFVLTTSAHKV